MIQPCSPSVTYQGHPGVHVILEETELKIHLSLLQVSTLFRGQGLARRVLEELCSYADASGKTVTLWAADPLTWSQSELVEFYKTFGFRIAGRRTWDDCIPMVRKPAR